MSGGGTTIGVPSAGFSPATLLARIKTVDGTGSGLDADLLDGQHGTYYLDVDNVTAGTLAVANGGTNLASYAVGDLLYASASTTLSKLAGVATGNALISGGVTTAPSWGKIGLATHIDGVLPAANGGTGVNNAGTLTNASDTTITGGGTLALGGFTLTVPATGTAGLLGTIQTWSAANTFSAITTVSNTTNASNATTGALVVGNGTSATSVAIGGGNIYAGGAANRMASGNVAASGTTLQITKGSLATSGNDWGILVSNTIAPGGASTQNATGITGNIAVAGGASGISGSLIGLDGTIDIDASANTFADVTGLRAVVRKGGANTITAAQALACSFSTSAAGTVTAARGAYISMTNSGGATVTTATGLRIDNVSIGSTNYAIDCGTGLVRFMDTTDSTSKDTGSIVTEGGIGAEKQITAGTGFRTGSTTLMASSVALTNGAAAQAGTLLNAPAAGNPTKWIPIDDNGTTRYIPAW